MPQGLQCWDAAGRPAVDLTDYNVRFMGIASVTFLPGETTKNIPYAGVTLAGSFVAVTAASQNNPNEYFCRSYDGGFVAIYIPVNGLGVQHTINVEVYNFQ